MSFSSQPLSVGPNSAQNPIRSYGRRAGWITQLPILDFSGGLNLRDAPTEIADNETTDCMNMTLDDRGGVTKRQGLTKLGVSMPGIASNIYYSPSLQVVIVQVGAALYKTVDFTSYTLFRTNSTSDVCGFTDFQGQLVYAHLVDGVFTYDGTTNTNRTATIKGNCIASWQNAVYVAGDPLKPSLVTRSATGDATGWTVGTAGCAQNQLREKDDTVITALGVGQGEDISGRPGLLVFKSESTYRINDSGTLAYVTIDSSVGAAGPLAVVTNGGVTAAFSKKGIYTVDPGGTTSMTSVGDKVVQLFNSVEMNFAKLSLVCAGVYRDRMLFSFPFGAGVTVNTLTLEFHPTAGWIVPHSFGMAAFTTYAKNDLLTYAIDPSAANAYKVFTGASDNGAQIACRFRTKDFQPAQGMECAFRRLRVFGRGIFDMYVLIDQDTGQGDHVPVSLVGTAFLWNDPLVVWNTGTMLWGPAGYELPDDFWSLGVGKSVAFMFKETSSTPATGPKPLETGVAPPVGSIAIYKMVLDYVQLGFS